MLKYKNKKYLKIKNKKEQNQIRQKILGLKDNTILYCRGRDSIHEKWDYGKAIKRRDVLQFDYLSGDKEAIYINTINLIYLVQFSDEICNKNKCLPAESDEKKNEKGVIMICHGWCPDDGPDYYLINTLKRIAKRKNNCKVLVPDFRPSYGFKRSICREKRVEIIYNELLNLEESPDYVILVGHSQGGAAIAKACSLDRVLNWNIRGILMIGSENPTNLDNVRCRPMINNVHIVHATGDGTIPCKSMKRCAQSWECSFTEITSKIKKGKKDKWGDDINHDFVAKDLIEPLKREFNEFLERC